MRCGRGLMHCVTPTHSFAQPGKVAAAAAAPAAAEGNYAIPRFVEFRATFVKVPDDARPELMDNNTKVRLALQFKFRNGKLLCVTLGSVLSYDK